MLYVKMCFWSILSYLSLFVFVHISHVATQDMFPVGNFEKLRRGNCSKCTDRLQMDIAQLPRLTLIKQRILQALGRSRGKEPQLSYVAPTLSPKAFIIPKPAITTPEPELDNTKDQSSSAINEIITFSETIGIENGETVISFKHRNQHYTDDVEAVGASLLLYIDRRRKIRKGGKGKKILLTVTDNDKESNYEEILTYLRTRVKRRRWKKLSLPLSVAKTFLDSGDRGLSFKVNCVGCGRLVQVVFSNTPHTRKSKDRKQQRRHGSGNKSKSRRRKDRASTRPILVISTRPKKSP